MNMDNSRRDLKDGEESAGKCIEIGTLALALAIRGGGTVSIRDDLLNGAAIAGSGVSAKGTAEEKDTEKAERGREIVGK